MKTVIVLTLLIATVFCLPVKRSASSSESSEEMLVAQRPPPILRKAAAVMFKAEPTQTTPAESNESTDSADDSEDADEESETDENEEEIETDSSESESGESATTVVPSTVEPSLDPIINTGRGDSMGYPSDYKKSIVYVDANDFAKIPSPYKSYSSEKLGGLTFVSKKSSAYDEQSINDVEKEIKLYKALQVHDAPLEEDDTSTPEVENMEPNDRQAALGSQEIVPTGNQDATAESGSEGSSAGDTPNNSASASASQEQNEEESDSSLSSEETTTTPGAADSENDSSQSTESQESDSDEETTQTTDATVIIAK
ncbi:osteopontin [Onychostoma macrolepis]|nr:osteopontin [Onychostoma macrolepis]XP_058645387.1 osteopontin [Onychostoma macrolepis]XP_058645388.1 osteopontin [Onychostoma macrolepis]